MLICMCVASLGNGNDGNGFFLGRDNLGQTVYMQCSLSGRSKTRATAGK